LAKTSFTDTIEIVEAKHKVTHPSMGASANSGTAHQGVKFSLAPDFMGGGPSKIHPLAQNVHRKPDKN
jgi:hypothetical protein